MPPDSVTEIHLRNFDASNGKIRDRGDSHGGMTEEMASHDDRLIVSVWLRSPNGSVLELESEKDIFGEKCDVRPPDGVDLCNAGESFKTKAYDGAEDRVKL